ncbi:MAG: hypothetical protein HZA49_00190 [Planctomycetes bacterium]|nr:hypothetical protein [Planctomycetota bacterium]
MISQRTHIRIVNWTGVFFCLVTVLCVIVVIIGKWQMSGWGNGNFPPLIGHLFVIGLGGLMLAGIASSAVATLLALFNVMLTLSTRHSGRILFPGVLSLLNIASFIYLVIIINHS